MTLESATAPHQNQAILPTSRHPSPATRHSPLATRHSAFTLVELLVVIGIIALMAAMAVPTMTATRGNAPSTGAADVANILSLARQKAVTTRSHTMVVFPSNTTQLTLDTQLSASTIFPRVSYTVFLEKITSDEVTGESRYWTFADRWHHLPKGAYFSRYPGAAQDLILVTNAVNGSGITNDNMPFIEFNSRGEVTTEGPTFAVQQGTGGLVALSTNAANTVSGIVYRITGAVKVYR